MRTLKHVVITPVINGFHVTAHYKREGEDYRTDETQYVANHIQANYSASVASILEELFDTPLPDWDMTEAAHSDEVSGWPICTATPVVDEVE